MGENMAISEEKNESIKIETSKPIVRVEQVFKIFKQGNIEVMALKEIDMMIFPGEIVVVMGPSGSGKSTLLNVIAGLEKPSAGKVIVNNKYVNLMSELEHERYLQSDVGIIFQFFNLIPILTVGGNVELPMRIVQMERKNSKEKVKDLLKRVGLESRITQRPDTLSGGEQQRVAIAQAMANNPKLILADEPTGNVDSEATKVIMHLFQKYVQLNPEKAIVIVTHNEIFKSIADRVIILKDGHIEHEEILKIEPSKEINPLNQINSCRFCGSQHIKKDFSIEQAIYKIMRGKLITSINISCLECRKNYSENVFIHRFENQKPNQLL